MHFKCRSFPVILNEVAFEPRGRISSEHFLHVAPGLSLVEVSPILTDMDSVQVCNILTKKAIN